MNLRPVHDLLRARVGLDPESLGPGAVASAVAERVTATGAADYLALLLPPSSAEFDELIERVVVPESWFFRGPGLFRALADTVRTAAARPFRALSAPCAAGEEPYSLAIALAEAGIPAVAVTIDGVDISRRNLERARVGVYSDFAFRELPESVRDRYFRPVPGGWTLDAKVRGAVSFRRGNLAADDFLAGESPYDLILCRNVLIYLTPAARERCLDHLGRLLKPGGLLAVGHAEPQLLRPRGYQPAGDDGLFLFRSGVPAMPPPFLPLPTVPIVSRPWPAPRTPPAPAPRPAAPTPAPEALVRARVRADAGAIDEALALCRSALAAAPSADGFSLLGVLLQAKGETEAAAGAFRKALYLSPDHPEALLHALALSGGAARSEHLRRRIERREGDQP
jgi:chemotaxis protein methyltransferase WspC